MLALGIGANTAVFSLIDAVLSAASLLPCWLPTLRATRVDPIVALRSE